MIMDTLSSLYAVRSRVTRDTLEQRWQSLLNFIENLYLVFSLIQTLTHVSLQTEIYIFSFPRQNSAYLKLTLSESIKIIYSDIFVVDML